MDAPDVIFYVSENDATAGGAIHILDIEENTFLDIDADILGKKTYTTADGVTLSNGMQLKFEGNVNPSTYSTGQWYVEGVGTAIKLIADVDLEIVGSYSDEQELLFDDAPFDQDPFSTASAFHTAYLDLKIMSLSIVLALTEIHGLDIIDGFIKML